MLKSLVPYVHDPTHTANGLTAATLADRGIEGTVIGGHIIPQPGILSDDGGTFY